MPTNKLCPKCGKKLEISVIDAEYYCSCGYKCSFDEGMDLKKGDFVHEKKLREVKAMADKVVCSKCKKHTAKADGLCGYCAKGKKAVKGEPRITKAHGRTEVNGVSVADLLSSLKAERERINKKIELAEALQALCDAAN